VEELIKREPFTAPELIVNPDVKNFYDFRVEDFILENYQTHPQIKNIPVAV
jgi:thymidylate synthase